VVKKTVTEKKRKANQGNSRKSTGPRTDRGKLNSRFNAVKFGLFAAEVVIPDCDGENAVRDFSKLLLDLQCELEPVGRFENMLVETVAAGFWRLRRATRAEYGATRIDGFWDKCFVHPEDSFVDKLNRSVDPERLVLQILNSAREEIRRTGTLCKESYKKICPLVEAQPCNRRNIADTDTTSEPVIDDSFIQRIEKKTESLQSTVLQVDSKIVTRLSDSLKQGGLPSAEESEKISRVRTRTEKEIDWALKTLYFLRKKRGHKKLRSFSNTNGRKES
jgi:hypothetical protein